MINIAEDFVSHENRRFPFRIGHSLASSLAGFLAGAVVASIVWAAIFWASKIILK